MNSEYRFGDVCMAIIIRLLAEEARRMRFEEAGQRNPDVAYYVKRFERVLLTTK